mmetsp:Transcript_119338/g.331713  ORF Transcript_119338/g.331713 Transcript_119338/m.331713 type:complete len:163 (-) Transcript_119338:227-715(-)
MCVAPAGPRLATEQVRMNKLVEAFRLDAEVVPVANDRKVGPSAESEAVWRALHVGDVGDVDGGDAAGGGGGGVGGGGGGCGDRGCWLATLRPGGLEARPGHTAPAGKQADRQAGRQADTPRVCLCVCASVCPVPAGASPCAGLGKGCGKARARGDRLTARVP